MVELIFASIMMFKSLLHVIGFVKFCKVGVQRPISGKALLYISDNSSNVIGALCLLAGALFAGAGVLYILRRDAYWIPAVAAIGVSQVLVSVYWEDAKYATFVNVALLVAVVLHAAASHFKSMVKQDVKVLMRNNANKVKVITAEKLSCLPGSVRRWLENSNVIDKPSASKLRILQKGSLRTSVSGRWMPFEAVQYFSTDPPAFVWDARIRPAPLLTIAGRDKYVNGRGHILIKPMCLFTAADAYGKEIDQGTLLRYLAEIAWFPHAAVSDYLRWESIDESRARVTMDYAGVSASGIYSFNKEGLVDGFEARRFGEFDGIYRKENWQVSVNAYRVFDGVPLGYMSEVTWKLQEGDFKWMRMELVDIQPLPGE